jgi:hypothetical protein
MRMWQSGHAALTIWRSSDASPGQPLLHPPGSAEPKFVLPSSATCLKQPLADVQVGRLNLVR